jgi:DNA-binding response OmpR family regulator/KaiC/GvpD/RAD55 family RecA-like ATPase
MESQSVNLIVSGIEPIDELMGGLQRGQLYLVHGEASGKSLFGIKFLIEGLKQGENGALVIRYSPEDAVRRFARLGYDCLDDVYSGRLVILEYSDDIIQKLGQLRQLTPVLRELEWLLGETSPQRLIFDPVASVLAGSEGSVDARAREFADWARSFGGTVVLIDNGTNQDIIESFKPLVAESFRLDVRGTGDRASGSIAFEKTSAIPDQAIEVDPSRGVFLLGRAYEPLTVDAGAPQPPSIAELESIREELRSVRDQIHRVEAEPLSDIDLIDERSDETDRSLRAPDTARLDEQSVRRESLHTQKLTRAEGEIPAAQTRNESEPQSLSLEELDFAVEEPLPPPQASAGESRAGGQLDELSDLLDDLSGSASPLDLDLPELETGKARAQQDAAPAIERSRAAAEIIEELAVASREAKASARREPGEEASSSPVNEPVKPSASRHGRASDLKIDSAIAARAVELLLRPPELEAEMAQPATTPQRRRIDRERPQPASRGEVEVHPKDFNVLIISDDSEITDLGTQALRDYTLEVVHDGVSGLAKLISFKPDLVVLDFDLPVIDGSKVLTLIRSALNVPIVIVSGLRLRAIDRVMASELGADYYLTKPFSTKELKHKARQLIARYRGIDSWIMNSPPFERSQSSSGVSAHPPASAELEPEIFTPYEELAADVEKRVKAAMETGVPFSIVGCRVPNMTANGGRVALRLFDIVRSLARENDLMSTNPRNDLVVLLTDADTSGAQAFAGRLRVRVLEELMGEPSLWIRSFPDLEESTEAGTPMSAPGGEPNRRSSDAAAQM